MKVAVVSTSAVPSPPPSYGGMEAIASYVAEALAEQHEVTMLAAKGSHTTKAALFETVEPAYEPSAGGPIEYSAWKAMKDELPKFDVVIDHTHFFHAARLRDKYGHTGVRMIKVVHDLLPWGTPPPPASYDVLAGVSKFHAKYLQRFWGVPVAHLYNGIPTDQIPYSGKKDDYLLFLSRLDPGKGADGFLNIIERTGARGILAGEDDPNHGISTAYRDFICQRSRHLGVDYRGTVSDMEKKELLRHARAVVVPLADPYREVFGIWMVEANAAGTPVFTLDKGACQELLTRETGGVADTLENLAVGLEAFLGGEYDFDPVTCRVQAQKFDISVSVKSYLAAVDSLTQ